MSKKKRKNKCGQKIHGFRDNTFDDTHPSIMERVRSGRAHQILITVEKFTKKKKKK